MWSDMSPVHDESLGDHDVLQVRGIVTGDAEVLQAVATVVVGDLCVCAPFRHVLAS